MKVPGLLVSLLLVCNPLLQAQLCNGSLGDPILNITFGSGTGAGPELPAGQTSYKYVRTGCPSENSYSLGNFVFGCFDDSWHRLIGDHTPSDQNGYFMLVNSAYVQGDLFVYTLRGLCPNTKYEFATWAKNALQLTACDRMGVDPVLTFTVETLAGATISSYSSDPQLKEQGDPLWRQSGMLFQPPVGVTDVVLRIKNTAEAGCGNVVVLDDITVRPCGPEVRATIAPAGITSTEVCSGQNTPYLLKASYGSAFVNPSFQWQKGDGLSWQNIPGETGATYNRKPTPEGSYLYRVLVAEAGLPLSPQCRIGSNEILITVLSPPFVQATGYVYGCLDGEVILLASGASHYLWTGPNGYTSNEQRVVLPKVQYADSGTYKVTGTTALGCVKSDSTVLSVYPNVKAFSSSETSICEGSSLQIAATGGTRFLWYPSTSLSNDTIANPIATPRETTEYLVRVANQFGCADTASIRINVWKKPHADAGPDLKTRLGLPVVLKGRASGSNVSHFWTPSFGANSTQNLSPGINPPQTTTYTLHVVSPFGCGTHTDNMVVKVYEKVLIPNAFSPNGDGINDTWYIDPLEFFPDSKTEVYNRFGQVVYRSNGYSVPWNGTRNGNPLPVGTYYYIVDLGVQGQPKLTGSVTILR